MNKEHKLQLSADVSNVSLEIVNKKINKRIIKNI